MFYVASFYSLTKLFQDEYFDITRNFDKKVDKFIKTVLMGSGDIKYYTYRVEFQARGMPHIHGVAWFEDHIKEEYLDETNGPNTEKVTKLVNKYTTVSIDTGNEKRNKKVLKTQKHGHKKTCDLNGECRFGYPRFPSDQTIIASPLTLDPSDDEEERLNQISNAKEILKKVKQALIALGDEECNLTLKEFLEGLDVDYDTYHNALKISETGTTIVLKRTIAERNINNYNRLWLDAWRANMDIQVVLDHYAVISYITDYLTKSENEMTMELLKTMTETREASSKEAMYHCIRTYFRSLEVGVSQCTYKVVSGMNLKASNVKTLFLATDYPEKRSSYWIQANENKGKNVDQLEDEISDDEENVQAANENEAITIPGREGKFKQVDSIHKKYSMRPKCLEQMCLAQFASTYQMSQSKKGSKDFTDNVSKQLSTFKLFHDDKPLPRWILLENSLCMVSRKKFPVVLKVHASKKGSLEEVYSELLMFLPWRNEIKDLRPKAPEHHIHLYKKFKDTIMTNRHKMFPYSNEMDLMEKLIASTDNLKPQHLYDTLDPIGQQENIEDRANIPPADMSELPDEEGHEKSESSIPDGPKFKQIKVDSDEEMRADVRKMSFEQRIVFDKVIQYCKDVIIARKDITYKYDIPQLIVHGGGGVGKSFMINVISKWAEYLLRKSGDEPTFPKVLLMAPTGKAASLIGKKEYITFQLD